MEQVEPIRDPRKVAAIKKMLRRLIFIGQNNGAGSSCE